MARRSSSEGNVVFFPGARGDPVRLEFLGGESDVLMSDGQANKKTGDFERLFQDYYRPVSHYFARRGCSREECQDLTQDTFMRVYRGIDSYRKESSVETWLFVIAANIWRNWLRSQGAQKRKAAEISLEPGGPTSEPGLLNVLPASEKGALDELLSAERYSRLREELENFPPRMRFCFLLRFYQGMKYREIATIMGCSVETVKSQIFQARGRLREKFVEEFDEL